MVLGPALLLVFLARGLLLVDGIAFLVEALMLEVVALLIHLKKLYGINTLASIFINERAEEIINYLIFCIKSLLSFQPIVDCSLIYS